jgi:hypothetical protein
VTTIRNKRKNGSKYLLLMSLAIILLLSIGTGNVLAYSTTVTGYVYKVGNQTPMDYLLVNGEPDATVTLTYQDNGTNVTQTMLTNSEGSYTFTVNDFPMNAGFYVNAAKDQFICTPISRTFAEQWINDSIRMGPLAINDRSVLFRVIPNKSIVNKNETIDYTVSLENNYATVGALMWINFSRATSLDVTNGDIFSKNQSDNPNFRGVYFNSTQRSQDIYPLVLSIILGPANASGNGTLFTSNATAIKYGPASLFLNGIQIVDSFPAWIRYEVITPTTTVTIPADINGDYNVTAADLSKVNYCIKMKYNVTQCGVHTDFNNDGNITLTDYNGVRYNMGKNATWEY